MVRKPHSGIDREVAEVIELEENLDHTIHPKFYGKIEFRDGESWTFITEHEGIKPNVEYEFIYSFTHEPFVGPAVEIMSAKER